MFVNGYYDYGMGDAAPPMVCTPGRAAKGKCTLPAAAPPPMSIGLPEPPPTQGQVAYDQQWLALGWPSKTEYHQAGRPAVTYSQYLAQRAAGAVITPGNPDGAPATGSGIPADTGTSGGGLGDMLSGIPHTYLLIGGAVVVFMLLKKR